MIAPSRLYALSLGLLAFITPAAHAQVTAGQFTPAQRQEIVGILRQALKDDPSILSDAIVALRQNAEKEAQTTALTAARANRAALQAGPGYAVRGNASGDVTLVEFLDPRCGYCRAMVPVVDRLIASDSRLRVVEKIVPVLSEKSVLDTQAILAAARQGGYEKMKRALMLDKEEPSIERIRTIARANGLDADRLVADLKNPAVTKEINDNLALAHAISLDGTPTFVFGTVAVIPGALSLEAMQQNIKAARAG